MSTANIYLCQPNSNFDKGRIANKKIFSKNGGATLALKIHELLQKDLDDHLPLEPWGVEAQLFTEPDFSEFSFKQGTTLDADWSFVITISNDGCHYQIIGNARSFGDGKGQGRWVVYTENTISESSAKRKRQRKANEKKEAKKEKEAKWYRFAGAEDKRTILKRAC